MTDYSDEQIARDDLATAEDFDSVILMQSGEIRNAATRAYAREYNHGIDSDPSYGYPGGSLDRKALKIEEGDDRWWQIWKDFDWIPSLFEPLSEIPSPNGSEDLAASVAQVSGTGELSVGDEGEVPDGVYNATGATLGDRALDGDANIRGAVEDWQGTAAQQFRNDFLKDIPSIVRNQTALAKALRGVALANAGLLMAARKDAQELGIKAKAAYDSFEPGGVDGSVKAGFAVLAAVATIAAGIAAIPSGGASVAGGLTVVAGLSSAASLAKEKKDPIGLGADTVEGIGTNVFDAVNKILLGIRDGEDTLVEQVLSPNYSITVDDHDLFVASRPDLISGPIDDFRPPEV